MSQAHNYLIDSSIAKSTNIKYSKALHYFRQYLHERHLKLHKLSPPQLDKILA